MKKTFAFIITSIALASTPLALAQQNIPPATGQNPTTGQSSTGHNSTGHNSTGHSSAGQSSAGQNSASEQQSATGQRATPGTPSDRTEATANQNGNSSTHATMTKNLADMQKQMTEMSTEMVKIKATRDDDDRQELIEAHMVVMQDTLNDMQGMMMTMQQMHSSNNAQRPISSAQ